MGIADDQITTSEFVVIYLYFIIEILSRNK